MKFEVRAAYFSGLAPYNTPMARLSALFNRPPMTWWDVVDILIVSLLIYEALKLIRGTRAMQMAIGSLLVLLLFYASHAVSAPDGSWLIRNVLAYVVFAAIVLFQSDIRRALSHLGRAPFFRYFGRAERAAETIEEVVTATGMLAKDRVGAIIVLEREIGLRNYVESGIPIDAEVSYDLLTTIFQPPAPLHDGAVIIQEDRIAAAACFLPLTVNPKLDRDLGTRHRAAIGLTEESDAVAVVVSEERGEILAVAERPDLTRPVHGRAPRPAPGADSSAARSRERNRRAPRRATADGLASVPQSRSEGRRARSRHAAVVHRQRAARRADDQRRARDLPERAGRRSRFRTRPKRRPFTCAATDSQIRRLQPGDLVVEIDLAGERPGLVVLPLRTDQVTVPFGIEVTEVIPARSRSRSRNPRRSRFRSARRSTASLRRASSTRARRSSRRRSPSSARRAG